MIQMERVGQMDGRLIYMIELMGSSLRIRLFYIVLLMFTSLPFGFVILWYLSVIIVYYTGIEDFVGDDDEQ